MTDMLALQKQLKAGPGSKPCLGFGLLLRTMR